MRSVGRGLYAARSGIMASRSGFSQAETQDTGMMNSLQPQSKQTCTSGDGVMGGWLKVRGVLR